MTTSRLTRLALRELSAVARHDPRDERVRLVVRLRARDACEYCLLPTVGQFHVDHVVPPLRWHELRASSRTRRNVRPRFGPDHLDNFAWACPFCNGAKGTQLGRRVGRRHYRLFDPRRDRWADHFLFAHKYLFIVGPRGIGRATEQALQFNRPGLDGPLGTRHDAILAGQYPPVWARSRRLVAPT